MFGRLFGGNSAGYRNATVAETQAAVTNNEVQFVDVRTREEILFLAVYLSLILILFYFLAVGLLFQK